MTGGVWQSGPVVMNGACRRQIVEHAGLTFPEECCGLLVGALPSHDRQGVLLSQGTQGLRQSDARGGSADALVVERVIPAPNIAEGDLGRRYQVDWGVLLTTYRLTRAAGQAVIGSYHSHPAGPAEPSRTDLECALMPLSPHGGEGGGYSDALLFEALAEVVHVIAAPDAKDSWGLTAWRLNRAGDGFEPVSMLSDRAGA